MHLDQEIIKLKTLGYRRMESTQLQISIQANAGVSPMKCAKQEELGHSHQDQELIGCHQNLDTMKARRKVQMLKDDLVI